MSPPIAMAPPSSRYPSMQKRMKKNKEINPAAEASLKVNTGKIKATMKKKKEEEKKAAKDVSKSKHHWHEKRWSPIHIRNLKDEMIKSLRDSQVLILVADSFSLKTPCIPLYLARAGFAVGPSKRIACTVPRSGDETYAAENCFRRAGYVHEEVIRNRSTPEVGCHGTVIVFKSVDGLLQEMARGQGSSLSSYSVVIVDNAHERTLGNDILLGLLLRLLMRRQSGDDVLRVVLTVTPSAAHEAAKLSAFFGRHCSTKTLLLPARPPPEPEISYIDFSSLARINNADYHLDIVLTFVLRVHCLAGRGNILLYLGGDSDEVLEKARRSIQELISVSSNPKEKTLLVHPLYRGTELEFISRHRGSLFILSPEASDVSPEDRRVRYVVDPGIGKHGSLISKQKANLRLAHLALNTPSRGDPKCFCLYSENVYRHEMPPTTPPEILTCSTEELAAALRLMKQLGVTDPSTFDFVDPPPPQALASAMEMVAPLPDISRLSIHH